MKQQHRVILACLAFASLIILSLVLSGRHQEQIRALTEKINEMTVKIDEMDVQLESVTSSSRLTNSAFKEAEQRIKALENELSSSEANRANSKDAVHLVWVLYSTPSTLQDWPEVEAALNAYSAEKIGVTCEFRYLDRDELADTILDGHEYDIAFTCDWWNDFAQNVSAGNFRDLTSDLDHYPELKDTVIDSAWSGTKVNDRIYAIPHMKDIGCEVFWILNSNYFLKEKGFEKDQYISFEEIEPYLKAYKDDHPDDYPIKISSSGITSWQSALVDWLSMDTLVGLDWSAQGTSHEYEVKSALEIDAWKDRLRTIHRWYQLGYINPDAAELSSMPRAQSGVVQSGQGWFGAETVWANTIKQPIYIARFDGPYLSTSSIQAMTAVSAYTDHPAEALKLIELMNTDPWYRETARYGIEGKHYIRNYDGTVIRTEEGSANVGVQAYAQGHYTLGALEASLFPEVPTDIHQWEKTMASYANATVSSAMGFTPDLSSLSTECEWIKKLIVEYRPKLYTGTADPDEIIPEMLSRMEVAGMRKVISEVQRQLDAFLANN
ncbi:MAG: ABC transporter substrate-binding protein [Oscillospiraceae bacterium]|nr:ABC transporter substrate-binding protein [Oscillospiraceae bacterium]